MSSNVLIVDDSAVHAQFLKNILECGKYNIILSHDGKNVIELIEQHDIDVVLLDIIMPELNGYDILSLLQKTSATRDIPVIMVTSLTSSQEVKKALDNGAFDFIRKTSDPIEVLARVNSALRLKRKQDMLKHIAQRDYLTQLFNKQYFNIALNNLVKDKHGYPNGISLIILDCDYFKRINDKYGHIAGDKALSAVANAISKSIKAMDIACRFGGEEFCVISPNVTPQQAYQIAERIRKNVQKIPFVFDNESVTVTISCGISHMKYNENKSSSKLVNEADQALYSAKNNGRNQSVLFACCSE